MCVVLIYITHKIPTSVCTIDSYYKYFKLLNAFCLTNYVSITVTSQDSLRRQQGLLAGKDGLVEDSKQVYQNVSTLVAVVV